MPNPNLVNFQRGMFDPSTGTVIPSEDCAVDSTSVYLVDGFKETPKMARIYYSISGSKSGFLDVMGSPVKVTAVLRGERAMERVFLDQR